MNLLELDLEAASAFVTAIAGSPSATIVLQVADDTPAKRNALTRVLVGNLRELWDIITRLNSAGAGIWLQINEGRRGARNVTALRAAFIDDDGKSTLPPLLRVPPSLIVQSSNAWRNKHYYWFLQQGESLDRFVATQKHLIAFYQSDKGIHNLDRVMRLPGTYNRKREQPEMVRIVGGDTRLRYTLASLPASPPLPEAASQALQAEPQTETHTPEALNAARKIGQWLTEKGVRIVQATPISFKIACPFNVAHGPKMLIRVQSRGGVWAGCFHESCVHNNVNRWSAVKDRIGGWHGGGEFHRGDHVEIAHRLLARLSSESDAEVVADQGQLWQYSARTGIWSPMASAEPYKVIGDFAGAQLGQKKVVHIYNSSADGGIGWACHLAGEDRFFAGAPAGISFANGFLAVMPNGVSFIPPSAENRQSFGLPYDYDEKAKCVKSAQYLRQCFRDDDDCEEKIGLLQ